MMSRSILSLAIAGLISLPVYAEDAIETVSTHSSETEPDIATALPAAELLNPKGPGFYTGLRVGSYSTSIEELSFGTPAGLVLGFGTSVSGIELEVNVADMEIQGVPMTYATAGIYASFRSSSKVFFKFRAGLAQQSIGAELSGSTSVSVDSGYGFSASVGGGVRLSSQALLDFDATVIDQDVTALSLGLNYFF